jgi:hypothetical protein
LGHPSRLLDFEILITSNENKEPVGRLLTTGLITGSKLDNQPTLDETQGCTADAFLTFECGND